MPAVWISTDPADPTKPPTIMRKLSRWERMSPTGRIVWFCTFAPLSLAGCVAWFVFIKEDFSEHWLSTLILWFLWYLVMLVVREVFIALFPRNFEKEVAAAPTAAPPKDQLYNAFGEPIEQRYNTFGDPIEEPPPRPRGRHIAR